MIIVQAGQVFSFNYTAYDQNASLFVAFNIYDVTTGTPSFIEQIGASYLANGVYSAEYLAAPLKSYLIIGVVYIDSLFITPDTTRAPAADIYQVLQLNMDTFGLVYTAFDQSDALSVQGHIYKMTLGNPVFVDDILMTDIDFGIYFGSYLGVSGETYQGISVVYTDGTFTTPDFTYAPACDSFDAFTLTNTIQVVGSATLRAPSVAAILIS